jgi:predicted PurR-regulated permease PerM
MHPSSLLPAKPDYLRLLLYIISLGVVLHLGQALFIPLSFALLTSFLLFPVCNWLEKRRVPRALAIFLSLFLLFALGAGLVGLLIQQFLQFSAEWPSLQDKLLALGRNISIFLASQFHLPLSTQMIWLESLLLNGVQHVLPLLRKVMYSSAVGVVFLILVPVYSALILYNREQLVKVLMRLFPPNQSPRILLILKETIKTYYNFIKGMLIVYLVVGILNVAGLLVLGIPHAFLFGIVASLLTFIPYIGISLGSLLPITVAWVTYDSVWYPVGVVGIFTFVQYLEANVIFPVAVSYRLQVNTLFMILAIITGGIIWGAAGMILFVPFLGILKLIADKTEGMETVALLLGVGTRSEENNITAAKPMEVENKAVEPTALH